MDDISKEDRLKAIKEGVRDGVVKALGVDHSYNYKFDETCRAFRKEITDAIERGVAAAMKEVNP